MLRRNVLIYHLGALGDFVITWPIAMALARIMAQSRIIYVTHPSKGKLAERALGVESANIENGWHELFSPDPKLPEPCLKQLAGAQLVFTFLAKPDDVWTANVRKLAPGAKIICLDTKPEKADAAHITQILLSQLHEYAMIRESVAQMLRAIESRGVGIKRSSRGDVVIHPGAGSLQKCYPAQRFAQVVESLNSVDIPVRLILGETEKEKWAKSDLARFEKLAPIEPVTFVDLMNEILSAGVFIGNDSGPGHLAGILGVPTISLFATDPSRWHPIGPKVHILRSDSIEQIAPASVVKTAMEIREVSASKVVEELED